MSKIIVTFCLLCGICLHLFAQNQSVGLATAIDKEVKHLMDEGDIPGVSVVIINDDLQIIKTYGYADAGKQEPVRQETLFELGSCSKAFTSMAVMKLVYDKRLALHDHISKYLPWLSLKYKDIQTEITVGQLLYHTSGIPWNTISRIPETDRPDALEQTIRTLIDVELDTLPGKLFEYATINYDILALIVQKVSGIPYEIYLKSNIIDKLGLSNTTIGYPVDAALKAKGYKIGYFMPLEYEAPIFKGNNAAGYVISNAVDMGRWLAFQMNANANSGLLSEIALSTHQRDETVALHGMSSYAMGWEVSFSGNRELHHGGLNPNYTSYVAFRPVARLGVAVLANSNSNYTAVIGDHIIKLLAGEPVAETIDLENGSDKALSIISVISLIYTLVVIAFIGYVIVCAFKGTRSFAGFSAAMAGNLLRLLFTFIPFLIGIYLLPGAIADFSWEAVIVWTPLSFPVCIVLILVSLIVTFIAYAVSLCLPDSNELKNIAPALIVLSIFSGLANMAIVILITTSIDSDTALGYLVFFYALAFSAYLISRRYVQVNLIKMSRQLTYELRLHLFDKIFSTSYQRFETIDRGKVYTVLNDDVQIIGESTNTFIIFISSLITATGAFIYLASIAFWATAITLFVIVAIVVLYYGVSSRANRFFEEARNTRDEFMRIVNSLLDGFKEISMHQVKKTRFKKDAAHSADLYREKITSASIRFVYAFLVGESLLIFLLGGVVFLVPELFPGIKSYTIMSFVVVLLYLIGPINGMLGAVPGLMQCRIAWSKVQGFLNEIPANLSANYKAEQKDDVVHSLGLHSVGFRYKNNDHTFEVGPINLEIKRGEILFVIGGNGSGKTTLAKLITGLYEPDEGQITINGRQMDSMSLSEYFSVVFSPCHLFDKIYEINVPDRKEKIQQYLRILNLEDKVAISDNRYSTIDLSGGQRKRLALLQCYLEDSPIYLFDEWAADQDPEYRRFFYHTLLPDMKAAGKIVIAITHDEHYFSIADKILKMNHGRTEDFNGKFDRYFDRAGVHST